MLEKSKKQIILGIETSCDDTSCAILEFSKDNVKVLSNIISSQHKIHQAYGGIVPNLAAREHIANLPTVLETALNKAKLSINDIDKIAVTSGPGLIPALLSGVSFAKGLGYRYNKKVIGVNHMEGHILSSLLKPIQKNFNFKVQILKKIFPAICLTVSGGHTQIILVKNIGKYKLLGQTVDDAAGEAFDKIARMLGLPYPGGPAISREAEIAGKSLHQSAIILPRPMIHSKDFNFSFSGLKTSVLYLIRDLTKEKPLNKELTSKIAYETQEAITDVLISKTKKAIEKYKPKSILLAGGVSANKVLREKFVELGNKFKIHTNIPEMEYTTDNGAMIAMAGYFQSKSSHDFKANANWEIT